MAALLSTQLESLQRERERLEELLMLDANWRALRQLEAREAAGEPVRAIDGAGLKQSLVKALANNRIYTARAKLLETIELLSSDFPSRSEAGSLASRIIMLSEPAGETFRARLRMKPVATKVSEQPAPVVSMAVEEPPQAGCAARLPDALELIDGLGRTAVEMLLDGGVTRFEEIARWSSVDVGTWRARLDGIAREPVGSWIEQAAILAAGHSTRFSERTRRGEFAVLVAPPEPEPPAPRLQGTMSAAEPHATAEPVARAGALTAVPPPLATHGRSITAAQLVDELAQQDSKPLIPPPLPQDDLVEGADARPARPAPAKEPRRDGYSRPRHRQGIAAGDGEVVVARPNEQVVPVSGAATSIERPGKLLRRLKALARPERFEADAYAAYRGSVEEASVTILPPGEAAPKLPAPSAAAEDMPQPSSRFLRALTGRS